MSLSVHNLSRYLNKLDPIRYTSLAEEIEDANQHPDEFNRRIAKIKKEARLFKGDPLVLKKRDYCLNYSENSHYLSTCRKCHSIAAFHAFNEIQNQYFKTKICNKEFHEDLSEKRKCPSVHPGEFFHNLRSDTYELYDPTGRYFPKSNYSNVPFSYSSLQRPVFSGVSFVPAPSNCLGPAALHPFNLALFIPIIPTTTSVFVYSELVLLHPLAPSNLQSFEHLAPIQKFQEGSKEIVVDQEPIVSPIIGPQKERVLHGAVTEEIGNPDINKTANAIPETDFPMSKEEAEFVNSILNVTFSGVEE